MIKPEFFDDPAIADLTPYARLFFIGLWIHADREGRLADDMRWLKAKIFPYETIDCEPLAAELHCKDMIRRYPAVEKHGWIWIRNFVKHQRPHPKEPQAVSPRLDAESGKFQTEPCKNISNPSESGVLILDSGLLSLDSGIRNLDSGVLSLDNGKPAHAHTNGNGKGLDEKWEAFKAAYPGSRRAGGFLCQQLFLTACGKVGFEKLLSALQAHKASADWKKGMIPGMQKFFEKELWIQEPEAENASNLRGSAAIEAATKAFLKRTGGAQ